MDLKKKNVPNRNSNLKSQITIVGILTQAYVILFMYLTNSKALNVFSTSYIQCCSAMVKGEGTGEKSDEMYSHN